ncbi:uncharacterized protein LOC124946283 [Impatiens glandulifera]|uniref:uncharacterized protein LOC124946283 n=1 Tax=Impatiens glandulifera TaxID=253017 RepID=UPI001FB0BCBC|nr:uncharacterized protein LOC124946283 [Impatiens glandulifera]
MPSRTLGNFLCIDFNSCMGERDCTSEQKLMYDSLAETGLQPFLEEAGPILLDDVKAFFRSACIRGKYIVSTVRDHTFWIDEPAPSSTGGRKKKSAKKAEGKGKGKEQVIFSEPPQQTEDEWASEHTDPKETEDDRTVNEDDYSAQSPNNAGSNINPETAEGREEGGKEEVDKEADDEGADKAREEAEEAEADRLARKLLQGVKRRAEMVEELYLEWHEHRFGTPYREILPGHTEKQCLDRLEEVEDLMMDVTNFNTLQEIQYRTCLLLPKVQLRKLQSRIRKITEEINKMESVDTFALRVIARLEIAKGELIKEIERLEAICSRMQVPVYTAPQIEKFSVNCPTPPREDAAPIESSDRADSNLTEQSPPPPSEVTASDFTKDWVEDRLQKLEASISERINSRIKEYDESEFQPFIERSGRIVDSALKFTEVTRNLLERHQERFSELGKGLWEEGVQQDKCVQRTIVLEDVTSDLKKDLDRLERDTEQRLTAMNEDLIGTTLKRVSKLEKINGNLVAEVKVLSEQMAEILRARAPRSSQLTETEEEAARIEKAGAIFPGFAEKVVSQAVEDAERLDRQKRKLDEYAKENKKKKAAASASAPKRRKKEAPKKVQIAELLNEVTDTIIPSASQQADQVEDEVEEQLQSRSKRRRSSEPTGRQQPKKKTIYDFSDSE